MTQPVVVTSTVADDQVRATIRALMAAARINNVVLGSALEMSDETLRRKLAASGPQRAFTAGEVARIADYFGKAVGDLYDGLGGQVPPPVIDPTDPTLASRPTVTYPRSQAARAARVRDHRPARRQLATITTLASAA